MQIVLRVKHEIKHASVLKKASFYRQSLAVLDVLQAEFDAAKDNISKEKYLKLTHKIYRDKSRLFFLMKDKVSENYFEEKASKSYCDYLEEKGIRDKTQKFYEFPILNIKVFKLVFNRAYRLTS